MNKQIPHPLASRVTDKEYGALQRARGEQPVRGGRGHRDAAHALLRLLGEQVLDVFLAVPRRRLQRQLFVDSD
ncbi:hypothetical protein BER93_15425 [Xanthomonas fragariae]|nr:hypothetical protein BER92_15385 [Xanthomonas fragariae]AOD19246.1 hypothetical protein BER93_15425 [Xanthomonas fragariae]ENZ95831.1 hypothetical protein O1K_08317 [Xanthomonas fragariae LMG 25863]